MACVSFLRNCFPGTHVMIAHLISKKKSPDYCCLYGSCVSFPTAIHPSGLLNRPLFCSGVFKLPDNICVECGHVRQAFFGRNIVPIALRSFPPLSDTAPSCSNSTVERNQIGSSPSNLWYTTLLAR